MIKRVTLSIATIYLFLSISIIGSAQIGPVILGPNGKPAPIISIPPTPIALEEAILLLHANSNAIKLSEKSVEIAKDQKQKINSVWYPYVTATGSYMHFSNDIEAKESLSNILEQLFPQLNTQQISGMGLLLSFPLLKQDILTINANITWPLFTGGKRIYANRIGKSLINTAEMTKTITTNAQLVILIETYYALKLNEEIVKEKQESVNSMILLFNNAMSLMRNGMINKAEMLVAQVAMEEAIRELESTKESRSVAENALNILIGRDSMSLLPISDFFVIETLPPLEYYKMLISDNNIQLKLIEEQQNITKNEKKTAISAYMPNIALFAKQTLYAYQVPNNIVPRTVVGAGVVWNIFDGLNREKEISISKKDYEQLQITKEQTRNDLYLMAHKLRSQMMDALYNIRSLESTTALTNELLRVREKSFAEGMANSLDVVSARATLSKVRIATLFAYWQFDIALANITALCGAGSQFMELYKSSQSNREIKY